MHLTASFTNLLLTFVCVLYTVCTFALWQVIDVGKSTVEMMPSKVEIKLRKTDPFSWSDLHYREKKN